MPADLVGIPAPRSRRVRRRFVTRKTVSAMTTSRPPTRVPETAGNISLVRSRLSRGSRQDRRWTRRTQNPSVSRTVRLRRSDIGHFRHPPAPGGQLIAPCPGARIPLGFHFRPVNPPDLPQSKLLFWRVAPRTVQVVPSSQRTVLLPLRQSRRSGPSGQCRPARICPRPDWQGNGIAPDIKPGNGEARRWQRRGLRTCWCPGCSVR